MSFSPAARPRPRPLLHVALALALGLAAVSASAAPGEAPDPLMQLIAAQAIASAPASDPAAESAAVPNEDAAAKPGLLRQVHDKASEMVVSALNFVGVRYKRGGTSAETGFDCSGFTRHVFELSLGLVLPRRADEQAAAPGLVAVKRDELKPGDLVFFNTMKRTFSHVGIYIGDNRFIHSPRTGERVRTEDMNFAYWAKRFTGARRVDTAMAPAAPAPIAGE